MLGFGLVTAAQAASKTKVAEAPRKERLISLIERRRSQMSDLDSAVRELRAQLAKAQAKRNTSDRAAASAAAAEQTVAAQAGALAVTGSGLRVKASDSAAIPDDAEQASAYRISDVDLQLLVNALWDAGAEAIALNGNRIVATSSIRAAGETIVVNFRPLTPPYKIEAVGADQKVFADSEIATRMRRWHTLFGLGFSTGRASKLTIPPYAGRVGIAVATPMGDS
jgi:uncharacterized protein YlxW (UPF0749 family)